MLRFWLALIVVVFSFSCEKNLMSVGESQYFQTIEDSVEYTNFRSAYHQGKQVVMVRVMDKQLDTAKNVVVESAFFDNEREKISITVFNPPIIEFPNEIRGFDIPVGDDATGYFYLGTKIFFEK